MDLQFVRSQLLSSMAKTALSVQKLTSISTWIWNDAKIALLAINLTQSSTNVNSNLPNITLPWNLRIWFSMDNQFLTTNTRSVRQNRQDQVHVQRISRITRWTINVRCASNQLNISTYWEGNVQLVHKIQPIPLQITNVNLQLEMS